MGPSLVLQKSLVPDGAVGQFRAVVLTGNEAGAQAGTAGAFVVGFSQDEITAEDAERGRVMDVRVMGISRAVAGAALTVGQAVTTAADGRVVAAAAGNYVIGRCTTPVDTADDWTAVLITNEGILAA